MDRFGAREINLRATSKIGPRRVWVVRLLPQQQDDQNDDQE
jgi:hypothetical protein